MRSPLAGFGARARAIVAVLAVVTGTLTASAVAAEPDEGDLARRDAAIVLRWTAGWNTLIWPAGSAVSGCFMERDVEWRGLFARATQAWMEIINLKLDFGVGPGYRTCSTFDPSDIRVTFRPGLASFSRAGTLALDIAPATPTLVITTGALGEQAATSKESRYGVMLHELGHALGLPHEHQHVLSPCPSEYRFELLCGKADEGGPKAARYLSLASVFNAQRTIRLDLEPEKQPPHDVNSIMHYRYSPEILRGGRGSRCLAKTALSFSVADRQRFAELYPKDVAAQRRFLLDQAAILQRTLAASGLSRATVERLARLIEQRVERRHGDIGFRINVASAALGETTTSDLEIRLSGRGRESGAPSCTPAAARGAKS